MEGGIGGRGDVAALWCYGRRDSRATIGGQAVVGTHSNHGCLGRLIVTSRDAIAVERHAQQLLAGITVEVGSNPCDARGHLPDMAHA